MKQAFLSRGCDFSPQFPHTSRLVLADQADPQQASPHNVHNTLRTQGSTGTKSKQGIERAELPSPESWLSLLHHHFSAKVGRRGQH